MPSSGSRHATARRLAVDGATGGEIQSCAPEDRAPPAIRDAHHAGDDYWLSGVDLLILRVADRLRRAGVDMPEDQLCRVAEDSVLDAAHFVLDWVEGPGGGSLGPRAPRRQARPIGTRASSIASRRQ